MVTQVTSFGRSGLSDWLLQRFTAVLMLAYLIVVVGFIMANPGVEFNTWQAFFKSTPMAIFSTATLFAIIAHAWIGLWVVSTDYLTTRAMGAKGTILRLVFQAGYSLVLFTYLVWGLKILWS